MKKQLYLFLLSLLPGSMLYAAAGDTTWVQANISQLSWNGNYDTTITFPSAPTTYRNVYMIFTLGKYVCPGSPTYCGDWDYTVTNYLMTPGGDTLELGRLITPYANSGAPRTPNTWTQRYVYDVTDYVSKLAGSATMRISYSGYSGGFTGNIKFAFVEGTPDRDVTGIERVWWGSYSYGGTTDINTHFSTVSYTAPTGTSSAEFKFNVTGHGSDDNGCCEFLSKNYQVMLNSTSIDTKAIWRSDCGLNDLYPQSGTWLYERGNWCPGASVRSNFHKLTGITAGTSYDIALQFDAYTSPGGGLGSYTTEGHVIYYGAINKTTDAGIDDIIAPTDNENHFRANPLCGGPVITVKNHGSSAITSMTIEYGVQDSALLTYNWTGSLAALASTDITLPELNTLNLMAGTTGTSTFMAHITSVNGASSDDDATNDRMTSQFVPSPKWDSLIRIYFKTNNEAAGGVSETSWAIYDVNNTIVAQRTGAALSTLYIDTVSLVDGCYRLVITDGGCDGLHWWVWDSNPGAGVTAGNFFVKKYGSNANIPMNGFVYSGTYGADFGCSFTQHFYVRNTASAVTTLPNEPLAMDAYPNPATSVINVSLQGANKVNGTLYLIDMMCRTLITQPCNNTMAQISTAGLANGTYTVIYDASNGNKLQTRIVVAK